VEEYLKTGILKAEGNEQRNAIRQAIHLYRIVNNELYRFGTIKENQKYGLRIVVHDDEIQKKIDILHKCHLDDMGNHLGTAATQKNISETYYWMGITFHVKVYIKNCEICKVRHRDTSRVINDIDNQIELVAGLVFGNKSACKHGPTCPEAKQEIKKLGKIKKSAPPETFFIVNTDKKMNLAVNDDGSETLTIDSNSIEYVVETLGHSEDGSVLTEVCHVLNVPEIVPVPERYRSREIENYLKYGVFPPEFTINQRNGLKNPATQYSIIEDELYHDANKSQSKGVRLVIHDDQPALKLKIIVENHIDEDGSHHGLNRTMTKISTQYHWFGMCTDVRKFMMHCKICNTNRSMKAVKHRFDNDDIELLKNQAERQKKKALTKMQSEPIMKSRGRGSQQITFEDESLDETVEESSGEHSETYNQVIHLVGPNNEVMEITVPVSKEDRSQPRTIQLDSGEVILLDGASDFNEIIETGQISEEVIHQTEAETAEEVSKVKEVDENQDEVYTATVGEDNSDVTCVEIVTNINNANEVTSVLDGVSFTVDGEKNDDGESHNVEGEVQESVTQMVEETEHINQQEQIEINEVDVSHEMSDEVQAEETMDVHGNKENAEDHIDNNKQSESATESEEELVEVLVINRDGKGEHQMMRKSVLSQLEADTEAMSTEKGIRTEALAENQVVYEEVLDRYQEEFERNKTYFEGMIFVPVVPITRAIEAYLLSGTVTEPFTEKQLKNACGPYCISDGVLCRQASRYKTPQIVVHDCLPQVLFFIQLKELSNQILELISTCFVILSVETFT